MRVNNGVVAFSGGADSATLLYSVITECRDLHALSIDYGQRHKKELDCARVICNELSIPHTVISFDLSCFGGSPLTDPSLKVPAQAEKNQAATVVPYRNTILVTLCAAYCKLNNLNTIYIGATYEDLASYEDCREIFFDHLEDTLRLGGTIHDLEIRTPFINMKKKDIVFLGHTELDVPYELTWTCYEGKDKPCLVCDACKERIESFTQNGWRDPLIDDVTWKEEQIIFMETPL